jgi:D-glutamate cyclase
MHKKQLFGEIRPQTTSGKTGSVTRAGPERQIFPRAEFASSQPGPLSQDSLPISFIHRDFRPEWDSMAATPSSPSQGSMIDDLELAIRRDPAQRGLISSEPHFGPLCPGDLAHAAGSLAATGSAVAIVTGFYIPRGTPPAAETDGPLGALVLAQVLSQLGMRCTIVTDELCAGAVRAAARASRFPEERILACPGHSPSPEDSSTGGRDAPRAWRDQFWNHPEHQKLSHLIAIERVGPSHTPESIRQQSPEGSPIPGEFFQRVPSEYHNHCHNMRGENIDSYSADLHLLFEEASQRVPTIRTIGIGDGANEIGMGRARWEDLARRLSGEHAGWVPCRIATDWNLVCGTSNWGGYALAAATAWLRNRVDVLIPFDALEERKVLELMVMYGPAVDGVTRRQEPTVDGLPFLTYIQPWVAIREKLGLDRPAE